MEPFITEEDIKKYDVKDMKSVLEEFPEQVRESWGKAERIQLTEQPNCIVVGGMGGSAIAGDLLKSYINSEEKLKLPFVVCRQYHLPSFVNNKSLVFISSYSGNTEETISMYNDAVRKNAQVVVITSGGKLKELAMKNQHTIIRVPQGIQPRNAVAYGFFPVLRILSNSGFINDKSKNVEHIIQLSRRPVVKEKAIELAEKISHRVPLIYASNILSAVAERWKTQFNENTKVHAFYNLFSELDHNEIVGFTNPNADYYVIMLRDVGEDRRIVKRMELTKDLIKKYKVPVTELGVSGDCLMTRMFTSILIGDWTSYFLAIYYRTDPTTVSVIEELKSKISS